VLLALLFLTPIFVFIPAACLGGVIILAAVSMFDWPAIKHFWYLSRLDLVPLLSAFFICFWDIAYGIIAGIFVHLCILLYKTSTPNGLENKEIGGLVSLEPKQGLYYPAGEVK
jgi:sodium-independent sulfate anion transporter 11